MDKPNENTRPNSNGTNNPKRNGFKEKFEVDDKHRSYCLSASGCFERHNLPKEAQYLSKYESRKADLATFNRTEYQERQLIGMVAYLQKNGIPLLASESLEEYVTRNKSNLTQEHQQLLDRMNS